MITKTRSIRNIILLLGGLVIPLAGCNSIKWEHDLKKGLQRAGALRKRVLLQFHSAFNTDCVEMDREVFTDSEVHRAMDHFIAVRVDYLLNQKMADELDVKVVPTFFVLRQDGVIVGTKAGKMNKDKFRVFLMMHRSN